MNNPRFENLMYNIFLSLANSILIHMLDSYASF